MHKIVQTTHRITNVGCIRILSIHHPKKGSGKGGAAQFALRHCSFHAKLVAGNEDKGFVSFGADGNVIRARSGSEGNRLGGAAGARAAASMRGTSLSLHENINVDVRPSMLLLRL